MNDLIELDKKLELILTHITEFLRDTKKEQEELYKRLVILEEHILQLKNKDESGNI